MITEEGIKAKLKEVVDPEIGVNIVDLGLIYEIKINDGDVKILMTLTTPGCPMMQMFDAEVERVVKSVKGVKKVKVEITFDPPWTPDKMSKVGKRKLHYA